MDPPYNQDLEKQVLQYLAQSSLIDADTLIVVEADLGTDFSYVDSMGFDLLRSKEYKTNKHIFLTRKV
jgi:16S rRNA G966 N2-methylase RsmD